MTTQGPGRIAHDARLLLSRRAAVLGMVREAEDAGDAARAASLRAVAERLKAESQALADVIGTFDPGRG